MNSSEASSQADGTEKTHKNDSSKLIQKMGVAKKIDIAFSLKEELRKNGILFGDKNKGSITYSYERTNWESIIYKVAVREVETSLTVLRFQTKFSNFM